MSSSIIGKRLIYEGDIALENKNYAEAINKYLESIKIGYFGEGESRLCMMANSFNMGEIEEKNFPDLETLLELGEKLLFSSGEDDVDKNEIKGAGYLILLNFIPEKEIPRDTRMYMNYLADLNL